MHSARDDTDLPGVLGTLAGGRAAGRPGGSIGIGVRPGALVVSLRQARSALPASRVQGRHMHAEEIASSRLLLNTVGAQPLQAYADAVLGPLDAMDRSGELMRRLTAFLEHNGTGDPPPPLCRSTGTPSETASMRSNDLPGGAWIPRRTATSCGWHCGPGTSPGCRRTR
jgi:hypothetical protein